MSAVWTCSFKDVWYDVLEFAYTRGYTEIVSKAVLPNHWHVVFHFRIA